METARKATSRSGARKRKETFTLAEYEATPAETHYANLPAGMPSTVSGALGVKRTDSTRLTLKALQQAMDTATRERSNTDIERDYSQRGHDNAGFASSNLKLAVIEEGVENAAQKPTSDTPTTTAVDVNGDAAKSAKKPPAPPKEIKFGWVQGVFVRVILNIWSVLMFIRISWMVGEAGIILATVIVLLSTAVGFFTALSMSAICTNGIVRGGGAYFMISRSLGVEFGGAIGLVFGIANMAAAAMHIVGFAETVSSVLIQFDAPIIRGQPLNDIRIIGCGTICVLFCIVMIGMEWEARAQLILLAILLAALVNYAIGTFLPHYNERAEGFTGYSGTTFVDNLGPAFRKSSFVQVFAVFFPACTGILAGANISGDLRNAQTAIPKGTLLGILTTSTVYVLFSWMLGATVKREAPGPLFNAAHTNQSMLIFNSTNAALDVVSATASPQEAFVCRANGSQCTYGLLHDYRAMEMSSAFKPLILAGIVAASVSSALSAMVSAPKIIQALSKDHLFPYIHVLAKGYGKNNEPWRAYGVTFFVASACILIADLNIIAPIISQFFLTVYALINYACFDASRADSPGFRPRFRYYNQWTGLIGAVLCVAVMIIQAWHAALVAGIIVACLWLYVHNISKPQRAWGTSIEANIYKSTLQGAIKLTTKTEEHVKTYRPQVLVLSGYPASRPMLVDIASAFAEPARALMICGHVLVAPYTRPMCRQLQQQAYEWLKRRHVKAFYTQITAPAGSLRLGARALLECVGVGKMRPNVVFLGYLSSWLDPEVLANSRRHRFNSNTKYNNLDEYVGVIHDAFEFNLGVGLLKTSSQADDDLALDDLLEMNGDIGDDEDESLSEEQEEFDGTTQVKTRPSSTIRTITAVVDAAKANNGFVDDEKPLQPNGTAVMVPTETHKPADDNTLLSFEGFRDEQLTRHETHVLEKLKLANNFNQKKRQVLLKANKEIHVWWLYDDGGLTVLIPFLLTRKWRHFKLKIFYLQKSSTANAVVAAEEPAVWPRTEITHVKEINQTVTVDPANGSATFTNGHTTAVKHEDDHPNILTLKQKIEALFHKKTTEVKKTPAEQAHQQMLGLLNKLRIDVDDATPVSLEKPSPEESERMLQAVLTRLGRYYAPNDTGERFYDADSASMKAPNGGGENAAAQMTSTISEEEFNENRNKTLRQLMLGNVIRKNSSSAAMVVVTLPMFGHKMSSPLYMTWLDCLTGEFPLAVHGAGSGSGASSKSIKVMPPMLLLRGNQQNVLTFDL